jgi:ATP-dependent exoDNAse (exonuclease V) alpha subunit
LYVAVTRARKRLVVYDADKDKRKPVFDLLIANNIVDTHWDDREAFFLASTIDEWLAKGKEWAANQDVRTTNLLSESG